MHLVEPTSIQLFVSTPSIVHLGGVDATIAKHPFYAQLANEPSCSLPAGMLLLGQSTKALACPMLEALIVELVVLSELASILAASKPNFATMSEPTFLASEGCSLRERHPMLSLRRGWGRQGFLTQICSIGFCLLPCVVGASDDLCDVGFNYLRSHKRITCAETTPVNFRHNR